MKKTETCYHLGSRQTWPYKHGWACGGRDLFATGITGFVSLCRYERWQSESICKGRKILQTLPPPSGTTTTWHQHHHHPPTRPLAHPPTHQPTNQEEEEQEEQDEQQEQEEKKSVFFPCWHDSWYFLGSEPQRMANGRMADHLLCPAGSFTAAVVPTTILQGLSSTSFINHTVDGQNPAPPRMMIIQLFIGFFSIPGGAGFRPSTVFMFILHIHHHRT